MVHSQAGDQAAYRRLLEEIAPYVRLIASRFHRDPDDVEDCVQDVLLTIHAVRQTYDPTRPFGPWLVALAKRRVVDRLRRRARTAARELPMDPDADWAGDPGRNELDAAFSERSLHQAVGQLPRAQRDAIRLLKLREMSLREASVASRMTIGALKVAAHRAMKTLRRMLVKEGGDT